MRVYAFSHGPSGFRRVKDHEIGDGRMGNLLILCRIVPLPPSNNIYREKEREGGDGGYGHESFLQIRCSTSIRRYLELFIEKHKLSIRINDFDNRTSNIGKKISKGSLVFHWCRNDLLKRLDYQTFFLLLYKIP